MKYHLQIHILYKIIFKYFFQFNWGQFLIMRNTIHYIISFTDEVRAWDFFSNFHWFFFPKMDIFISRYSCVKDKTFVENQFTNKNVCSLQNLEWIKNLYVKIFYITKMCALYKDVSHSTGFLLIFIYPYSKYCCCYISDQYRQVPNFLLHSIQ